MLLAIHSHNQEKTASAATESHLVADTIPRDPEHPEAGAQVVIGSSLTQSVLPKKTGLFSGENPFALPPTESTIELRIMGMKENTGRIVMGDLAELVQAICTNAGFTQEKLTKDGEHPEHIEKGKFRLIAGMSDHTGIGIKLTMHDDDINKINEGLEKTADMLETQNFRDVIGQIRPDNGPRR